MFFENELTGTLTFLHILVAILFGIAPVALTIAIKVALYRRRLAEDAARSPGTTSASEPVASTFHADQSLDSFATELRTRLALEQSDYAP